MSRLASPLRYPGGKACLAPLASELIRLNGVQERAYAEPYSGGCGLALNLLFSGLISRAHLNDVDRSVWAFWEAITTKTDEFVALVREARLDLSEWEDQRSIQARKGVADVLSLGFSTFYLNRTNRSGIIHSGGVIGGKNQRGNYKIDCRFNKEDLVERIRRVANYKGRISFYNEDAEHFLTRVGASISEDTLFYIDPPYFEKGAQLYQNSYRKADHERIAALVSTLSAPWFLTYDNVPEIAAMYSRFERAELDIGYSIQTKRRGSEILVVSDNLRLPTSASRKFTEQA